MKKIVLLISITALMSSCKMLRGVETAGNDHSWGVSCEHPIYVTTIAKDAKKVGGMYDASSLGLSLLFREAQEKYGTDVTISNLRWDVINGKRYSVVYDVVKCK